VDIKMENFDWGELRALGRRLGKSKMPRNLRKQLHGIRSIPKSKHLVCTGKDFKLQELSHPADDHVDFKTEPARSLGK
jgi:hypothetical protein